METAIAVGKLLTEEVVATADRCGTVDPDEGDLLPVPARIDDRMIDPDCIHPRHPFRCGRLVLGMDRRLPAVGRAARQPGKELGRAGPVGRRERFENVARDRQGEEVEAERDAIEPGAERMLGGGEPADLPV